MPNVTMQEIRQSYPQYSDMTDEQLATALHAKHYSDMPFATFAERLGVELPDKKTGASMWARALAGRVDDPAQKLAVVQKLYPDAQAYGDGNYTFRDPQTGKLTLFNPEGLDMGDIPGVGREITQAVTSTLGAVAGAPGGPLGAAAGAGAGGVVGGKGYDALLDLAERVRSYFQGKDAAIPERTLSGEMAQTGVDFAGNAAGQFIGDKVGLGLMKAFGPGTNKLSGQTAEETVKAASRLGIDLPSLGVATGSKPLQLVDAALSIMPTSSGVMAEASQRALTQSGATANRIASEVGTVLPTNEALGHAAVDAATASKNAFQSAAQAAENRLYETLGGAPATLDNTKDWIASQASRLPPEMAQQFTERMTGLLGPLLTDAESGALNIAGLRRGLTELSAKAKSPNAVDTIGMDQGILGGLLDSLRGDRSAAANAAGGWGELNAFNNWYSQEKAARGQLARILGTGEQAALDAGGTAAVDASRVGANLAGDNLSGDALRLIREKLGPDFANSLTATRLANMGRATNGAQSVAGDLFSPSTMLTRWNAAQKSGVRDAMLEGLSPETQSALMDLLTTSAAMKDAESVVNRSMTAGNQQAMKVIEALGMLGAGSGLMGLDLTTAASLAATPYALAQASTARPVVNALANPSLMGFGRNVLTQPWGVPGAVRTGIDTANDRWSR